MRRLTVDDCDHLLGIEAGTYEIDRALEGGEDTIGHGGVARELVRQLRDALAAASAREITLPNASPLAGPVAGPPTTSDDDPRIPPWIPRPGGSGAWVRVEDDLPPPLTYHRVRFADGREGSGRMGWRAGPNGPAMQALAWVDLYIGAAPNEFGRVVAWQRRADPKALPAGMRNLDHPNGVAARFYAVSMALERFPASPLQTEVSSMLLGLRDFVIARLEEAEDDAPPPPPHRERPR